MFRIHASGADKFCDGMSRRNFVQLGVAGMGALSLPQMLRAKEASQAAGVPKKNTAVILIWLDGGPSHMDMYDMKPEAPVEYRGIWQPIQTNVPGMEITELLPLQAKMADKFSLIRSMHHDNGDHFAGAHWMLTGHDGPNGNNTNSKNPSISAIAAKLLGPRQEGMPAHVGIPEAKIVGKVPGALGAAYLGSAYNPLNAGGNPNDPNFKVQNLSLPKGLTLDRLQDRRALLSSLDTMRRDVDTSGALESMDRFQLEAYNLVSGGAVAQAFDLTRESNETRDRYGRNTIGQSALLARRLVESGVTFVTVNSTGWDNHGFIQRFMEKNLPEVDRTTTALLSDLQERGLYDQVMVVMCGEFGRTPKMNNGANYSGNAGRDHWGNAMTCWVAGGGIKGGMVVGSTDSRGERAKDRPVRPGDLHHTIFHVLGIDPTVAFTDRTGRPVHAIDHGDVIHELL